MKILNIMLIVSYNLMTIGTLGVHVLWSEVASAFSEGRPNWAGHVLFRNHLSLDCCA